MEVYMLNCLSAILAAVVDDAEAVAQTVNLGNLGNSLGDCAEILSAVFSLGDIDDVIEVLLGNNEYVRRRNRIDVPEAQNLLVLIYLCGRDLSLDDVTENAH